MLEHELAISREGTQNESDAIHKWIGLSALFSPTDQLASDVVAVPLSVVPEPYKSLFVHHNHMTAVMERFHGSPVDVTVVDRRIDGDTYSRKIVLTKRHSRQPVQFARQFSLRAVSPPVRDEILSEQIPLGSILINHRLACDIELKAMLKITIGAELAQLLESDVDSITYGRIARILCNGKPTFDVIEISAPLPPRYEGDGCFNLGKFGG